MYWFRNGSAISLIPWLLTVSIWWGGGWLLVTHLFKLEKRERLLAGFGVGMLLYMWLVNVLGYFIPATWLFIMAALVVLLAGALVAWRSGEIWLNWEDLRVWRWLFFGLGLVYLFVRFGKGLALFDEHKNLSLISMIGTGDIPPRFMPGYPVNFVYHYGFHLFGASLMRLGGMLPWSAFDLAKAIVWAYMVILAGLVGQRYLKQSWGALVAGAVLALAGGTRYLLLLLPPGVLLRMDQVITLTGTSAYIDMPFSQALLHGWTIDGGPPSPYIFAFLNGLFDPMVISHQGPNATAVLIFLLVWLLAARMKNRYAWIVMALIFSIWALVWETTYGLFALGLIGGAALIYLFQRDQFVAGLRQNLYAISLSIPIVALQGGTITEMIRREFLEDRTASLLNSVSMSLFSVFGHFSPAAEGVAAASFSVFGFSLRWPWAVHSAHFEPLILFSPLMLLVAIFEIGPILFFAPWITVQAWKRSKSGDWLALVLAVSAWFGLLIPIIFDYSGGRDISRLTWQGLLTWTMLLVIYLFDEERRGWLRKAGITTLLLMCFGGVMILGTQFSAATTTQLAHRFTELDAALAGEVWGELPEDAKIFGNLGRTTILTGHLTGQILGSFPETSLWAEIERTLSLDILLEQGYDFVLIHNRWPEDLPESAYADLEQACVQIYAEVWDSSHVNFRRIYDLRGCTP